MSESFLRTAARFCKAAALSILPIAIIALMMSWAYLLGYGHGDHDRAPSWYANTLGGSDRVRWVAFFEQRSDAQYFFMGAQHKRDLINLALAASPMIFVLPLALRKLFRRARIETWFLFSALAGLLVLPLFWNADYGIEWDFDLMAMFALPAHLLVMLWWGETLSRWQQTFIAITVSVATFFSLVSPLLLFP